MKNQKDLIEKVDWDYLIILDACRYDYFEELYESYLEGELRKAESEGTYTGEWLFKTFEGHYPDITYISAAPPINGKGIPLNATTPEWNIKWKATEHFPNIVDVWDFAWSKEMKTVPPAGVTETALQLDDGNKKIIHFMQPHEPYLSLNSKVPDLLSNPRKRAQGSTSNLIEEKLIKMGHELERIFGKERTWRLKASLGLPAFEPIETAWRTGRIEYYYTENLKIVLKEVSKLVKKVSGEIIVTSDHGECLGENDYWGHGYQGNKKIPRVPQLIEVPWLEVS